MGTFIEFNDLLQITKEQGFPEDLNLEQHLQSPYKAEDFSDKVYTFTDKPKIRIYNTPPIRNFLVENIDGKWVYWGLIHVLSTSHDYETQTTSGTFRITHINNPEEMKLAHDLTDRVEGTRYFSDNQ